MPPSRTVLSPCHDWRPLTSFLANSLPCAQIRCFSTTRAANATAVPSPLLRNRAFFLPNTLLERTACLDSAIHHQGLKTRQSSTTTTTTSTPPIESLQQASKEADLHDLPAHRRRQARKRNAELPPDASSLLSTSAASAPPSSLRRTLATLLALSKPRLSALVVLTAMAPYALYPVPAILSSSAAVAPSLSPLTLFFLTTGTALCSASANALNMLYEPATDAKMSRTRNRPLVRNLISKRSAVLFAVLAGAVGVGSLYFGVNPTVSFLGFANIGLYAGVYTPLKAVTAFNTWVGAVVGGIPPLMGWAAAAGETASKDGSWRELLLASDGSSLGGWLMASLLFAWQFPHFMALSWGIREEYKNAGLRMLAWTNPARNARVALRYSIAFIPICLGLCAAGVTDWGFAVTSLPINLWLAREAVRFWKFEGHQGSARGLFWASVWHLPGVMILALLHKKGMWQRAWESVFGSKDEGEWEEEELEEMASMTAARVAEKAVDTKAAR